MWVAVNAFLTAAGSCELSAWGGVGGRMSVLQEARSVYHEPAVCLEYFIQHSPACVREPFSPLHSCQFTQQEPLHSVSGWEVSLPSPSLSLAPLPLKGRSLFLWRPAREGLPFPGWLHQDGDFFHCFCFPVGRTVGSQPRTVSLFLQNSGVRGDLPTFVCPCHLFSSTHIQIQTRPGLCSF